MCASVNEMALPMFGSTGVFNAAILPQAGTLDIDGHNSRLPLAYSMLQELLAEMSTALQIAGSSVMIAHPIPWGLSSGSAKPTSILLRD